MGFLSSTPTHTLWKSNKSFSSEMNLYEPICSFIRKGTLVILIIIEWDVLYLSIDQSVRILVQCWRFLLGTADFVVDKGYSLIVYRIEWCSTHYCFLLCSHLYIFLLVFINFCNGEHFSRHYLIYSGWKPHPEATKTLSNTRQTTNNCWRIFLCVR
jgi:hypothetical protein